MRSACTNAVVVSCLLLLTRAAAAAPDDGEKAPAKPADSAAADEDPPKIKTKLDEVEPAAPKSNPWQASGVVEDRDKKRSDSDLRMFAIGVNPLGVAIGRYCLQFDFLPIKHHAVSLSPFFTYAPVTFTVNGREVDGGELIGFGSELGYRFYTGSKGANGFFAGPSFLFGSYSTGSGAGGSLSFLGYGGAIDIGGQAIVGPGVVIGGGAGLQYTVNSEELKSENLNLASAVIVGGGFRPRFLLTVGYAF